MYEIELISLIKTLISIMIINTFVTFGLLFGLVTCLCLIRRLRNKIKENLIMIQGLELSCNRLIQEFLQLGEARVKIKLFADKLNIRELQDM